MSGNAVARRLALQQSAVRKALERLVARGVVTRTDVGRAAAYALDTRREVVRRLVLPAFQVEAALGERLRQALRRAAEQLRPAPAAVVLYGSVARGARAPGDVDLLLVVRRDADAEPVRSSLLDAVRGLEIRFQVAVNPVVLSVAELQARAADPLITAVAAEGVLLAGQAAGPLRRVRRLPPPAPATPVAPPVVPPPAPRARRAPRNAG
jgi:DNA-binding Lrp family transcriptional regulator